MPLKKNQQNYWSLYPSEPFTIAHFNVRHPVQLYLGLNMQAENSNLESYLLWIFCIHIHICSNLIRAQLRPLLSHVSDSNTIHHFRLQIVQRMLNLMSLAKVLLREKSGKVFHVFFLISATYTVNFSPGSLRSLRSLEVLM